MYFWVLALAPLLSCSTVYPVSVLFLALSVWALSWYLFIWTDTGRGCGIETCLESLWKTLAEQPSRRWTRLSSWESEPCSLCAPFHLGCTKELEEQTWKWSQITRKRQNLWIIREHGSSASSVIWHFEVTVAVKGRLMCILVNNVSTVPSVEHSLIKKLHTYMYIYNIQE